MTVAVVRPARRWARESTPWLVLMVAVVGLLLMRLPVVQVELAERLRGGEAPPEAIDLDPAYTRLALQSGAGAALAISIVVALVMLTVAMKVAVRTRAAGSVTVGRVPMPLVLLAVAPTVIVSHLARLLGHRDSAATVALVLLALVVAGAATALVRDHRWGWPARFVLAATCALVFALL